MNVVVTDTGPLLHLHQVGAMHLLAHLGDIQLTPTVWSELQRHAPSLATSGLPAWLSLAQPSASTLLQASQWVNAQVLHAGEAEALAYARETQADLFLTDDTAALRKGVPYNDGYSSQTTIKSIAIPATTAEEATGARGKGLGEATNQDGEMTLLTTFTDGSTLLMTGRP